ncbi:MAG: glycosyltransferase, partial [Patescibacteria group bacterium]|nr:glycosyltransferase [Patescibacteria group bacterium]
MTILTYTLLFVSLYFEVFLLVSFLERKFYKHAGARAFYGADALPSVAIVVPCFNEERTIESTLKSLAALDYPKEKLEIIVVDDGSTDRTHAIAQEFAAALNTASAATGGRHLPACGASRRPAAASNNVLIGQMPTPRCGARC